MTCHILVYGGGAVGSVLGWRLAQCPSNEVSVVCRSNFAAVQNAGYSFATSTWGKGKFAPKHVYESGSVSRVIRKPRFDYVVCATKMTGSYIPILQDLRSVVHPDTTLVTAQNGMETEAPLRQEFGHNPLLALICSIACQQIRPGYVEQTSMINKHAFAVGTHAPGADQREIDVRRRDQLAAMATDFESVDSLEEVRWTKLVFNSAWNSTTALAGLDTHELLAVPGAVELVRQLANEAYEVAIASGVSLDSDIPARTVDIAGQIPSIVPSTLQDARLRRPMELGPIFGYLTTQASKLGVHIPYMTVVNNRLQQMNDSFMPSPSETTAGLPAHASHLECLDKELSLVLGWQHRHGLRVN